MVPDPARFSSSSLDTAVLPREREGLAEAASRLPPRPRSASVYRIYRDSSHHWRVESDAGNVGGIFICEQAARWFARTESIESDGPRLPGVAEGGDDDRR
jgi:hypothetical protein